MLIPLESLLWEGRSHTHPVARGADALLHWGDLTSRVGGLMDQLATEKTGRWLLSCRSSFSFLTGLLALWATDRVAVVAPNEQPGSLRETATGLAGILRDPGANPTGGAVLSLENLSPREMPRLCLNTQKPLLELFTSGSTGERRVVAKTLRQLSTEILALEKAFGGTLDNTVFLSTVPHQHIYGLLFRLLWPLCAGRPFEDETLFFWPDLKAALERHPSSVLITSPTYLEHLQKQRASSLLAERPLRAIFSSGAKLKESLAAHTRSQWGTAPIEVYGSTETGGVGWRQQTGESASLHWRPLPGVILEEDAQGLKVTSPFLPEENVPLVLGDTGRRWEDGRFQIDGRRDRIVKISEKRLSLDDLEQRLCSHPFVKTCQALPLASPEEETRILLGVVVLLTAKGKSALLSQGDATLRQTLRQHLINDFDPVLVPKRFRFVDSLPVNSIGKISREDLRQLFRPSEVTEPFLDQMEKTASGMIFRGSVPENLVYLEGHFPHHPLVPGVVQLLWVSQMIEKLLGKLPDVSELESIKFKSLLKPGQRFSLHVDSLPDEKKKGVEFVLRNEDTVFSSGKFLIR